MFIVNHTPIVENVIGFFHGAEEIAGVAIVTCSSVSFAIKIVGKDTMETLASLFRAKTDLRKARRIKS